MNCPHATLEEETMLNRDPYSRRDFIRTSGALAGTVLAHHCAQPLLSQASEPPTKVSAHIWVYASKYPPNWDATPDLDRAFSDLKYAGFDGVELMEVNLRHDDAVEHIDRKSTRLNSSHLG